MSMAKQAMFATAQFSKELASKLALTLFVIAVGACVDDFPGGPQLRLVSVVVTGPDTIAVTDVDTLVATFVDANGDTLKGLGLDWQSDDSSILTVTRMGPSSGAYTDSAKITARASGSATIVATVTHTGFQPVKASLSITVGRWGVEAKIPWPDTLTVTDLDTIELEVPNTDSTLAGAFRVVWLSDNDAVASVVRELPPDTANRQQMYTATRRAVVTAHRTGVARVFATVSRDGFESVEVGDSLVVRPLTVRPVLSWPDTVSVSDSLTIEVSVLDYRGSPLTGRRVQWRSTDSSRLEVAELAPTRGALSALARGSVSIVASVDEEGFESAVAYHRIQIMERWIAVSAGERHTCGITWNYEAFCWGEGSTGALGNGRQLNSTVPVQVGDLADLRFATIAAGGRFTCATLTEKGAHCWGLGTLGRLGDNDASEGNQFAPVPVAGGHAFISVSANWSTSCAVTDTRQLFCWGDNTNWQLAYDINNPFLPSLDHCGANQSGECSLTPLLVPSPTGIIPTSYASVSVGGIQVCSIAYPTGVVYCWGKGALGSASLTQNPTPVPIASSEVFTSIATGNEHSCGVTVSDKAFCWGTGAFGQLGTGSSASQTPEEVVGNHTFRLISAGKYHTCAVTTTSRGYCWGRSDAGQLGNGATTNRIVPDSVRTDALFESIAAGAAHTCGINIRGALLCWGSGGDGQLGNARYQDEPLPKRVIEPR
jgi:alpha-tubulin suppressor-like RCC1 family protein